MLWRSALFVAIAVPLRLAVATGLALLLHARARGARAGRTFAFLPSVVPDAAWAMIWLFLLNPIYGPVNWLLGLVGIAPVSWFSDGNAAFVAIVLMLAFTVGEAFIVALAARQELPEELYSVARLEGAGAWFVLRTVTLPLMAPVLALLATRDVAVSLQATFTATYLLTDGGPDRATLFLPIYSFDMGFELLRYGYASAMMLLGFLGCLALGVAAVAASSVAGGWAFPTEVGDAEPRVASACSRAASSTTRPSSSSRIRSASRRMSRSPSSAISTAVPAARIASSAPPPAPRSRAARGPPTARRGSATRGSVISPRAITSICCSPPESVPASCVAPVREAREERVGALAAGGDGGLVAADRGRRRASGSRPRVSPPNTRRPAGT